MNRHRFRANPYRLVLGCGESGDSSFRSLTRRRKIPELCRNGEPLRSLGEGGKVRKPQLGDVYPEQDPHLISADTKPSRVTWKVF